MLRSMVDKTIEDSVVADMRAGIFHYLKNNPKDSASNIAVDMVSNGFKIEFVSMVTCLSVDEINKLYNSRH